LEWLLAQQAGEAGLRWFQKLKAAIDSLSQLPHRCPLAPENENFPFELRQLLYGRKPHQVRVLFTIEADMVIILHIRHGRRRRLGEPH
jgi:plasmid stabilization system protein ParE